MSNYGLDVQMDGGEGSAISFIGQSSISVHGEFFYVHVDEKQYCFPVKHIEHIRFYTEDDNDNDKKLSDEVYLRLHNVTKGRITGRVPPKAEE